MFALVGVHRTGSDAEFNVSSGVAAVDVSGNAFVGDLFTQRIRKITPDGVVSTLAGDGAAGSIEGIGTDAEFANPFGVAAHASGNVLLVDSGKKLSDNERSRLLGLDAKFDVQMRTGGAPECPWAVTFTKID